MPYVQRVLQKRRWQASDVTSTGQAGACDTRFPSDQSMSRVPLTRRRDSNALFPVFRTRARANRDEIVSRSGDTSSTAKRQAGDRQKKKNNKSDAKGRYKAAKKPP